MKKEARGKGGCRSANFVSKRFRGIEITEFRFCPSTGGRISSIYSIYSATRHACGYDGIFR
jgi:hypothetical protein